MIRSLGALRPPAMGPPNGEDGGFIQFSGMCRSSGIFPTSAQPIPTGEGPGGGLPPPV